jgi:DNA-directed RNA polymerase subunit RPC12/RpoP
MATIKVACPKCGQKVSGDESFYGTVVECPICSSDILFPGQRRQGLPQGNLTPVAPEPAGERQTPVPRESADPDLNPDAVIRSSREPEESPDSFSEKPVEKSAAAPSPSGSGKEDEGEDEDDEDEGEDEDELLFPPSPIFGAISIVSAFLGVITCLGGVLFAPLAIIFGHTALAKARHSPVQPAPGHTLGAIGLMIGYIDLVLIILVLLAMVFFGEAIRGAVEPFLRSLFSN